MSWNSHLNWKEGGVCLPPSFPSWKTLGQADHSSPSIPLARIDATLIHRQLQHWVVFAELGPYPVQARSAEGACTLHLIQVQDIGEDTGGRPRHSRADVAFRGDDQALSLAGFAGLELS